MREGWSTAKIGDICTLTKGTTPTQKAIPGPYPLVVTAAEFLSSNTYQFEGEAVCVPLVSSTGHGHASLKRVHYASGRFAVANIITALQPKADAEVSMRYLWLLLDHGRDDIIVPLMKGTANVSLSQNSLASATVLLPPLDEQRRIVDLIGSVDDAIEAAEAAARRLGDFITARLRALMSAGSTLPLGQLASFASGSAFPPAEQNDPEGTIPFIKVSDMNLEGNETYIVRAQNYITESTRERMRVKTWPAGTVVFPKVGAALLTEKRRVLSTDTALDNNIMGLIPREGRTVPGFLFACMRTIRLGDYAQIGALPSVNQRIVKSIPVLDAPLDLQERVEEEIKAADDGVMAAIAEVNGLRCVRSNLLSALLSGEHEIPESYDELLGEAAP